MFLEILDDIFFPLWCLEALQNSKRMSGCLVRQYVLKLQVSIEFIIKSYI